jgi:flagellar basal body-associated protein FliL
MFENRARKRKRNILLLIVALIFVSAFGFGYYLNFSGNTDVNKDNTTQGETSGYKIPSNLRNPSGLVANADPGNDQDKKQDETPIQDQEQATNANPENLITASTKIIFKTYFTLCSHMVDKEPEDMKDFINLSESALKSKFSEWTVNEFSTQQVILKREKQTYCPRHYIIGSKDGYIAIYVYNSDGIKTLYEMTESPVSILTTEDQKNLEYGIVADSEEELQQKLEGLSD